MAIVSLDDLTRDDFAAHEDSTFVVVDRPGLHLTLTEVTARQVSEPWESFTLSFRGSSGQPLDQSTYLLSHDVLGDLELFVVPLGPDAEGPRYESVFSRAVTNPAHEGA